MKLISHRGNVNGLNPERENSPSYIDETILAGYDVEVDVWHYASEKQSYWLGHDEPEYLIDKNWLIDRKDNLWIHCKNFEALTSLLDTKLNIFYHENEKYTILSNKLIWAHDIDNVDEKCIIPLLSEESIENYKGQKVYGICSDFVSKLQT